MYFVITFDGSVSVRDEGGQQPKNIGDLLEAHLDAVMEEFYKIGAQDPDIDLDLGICRVRLSILVEAADPDKAIYSASGVIRSAIHGAGGSTPDWPDADNRVWSVRQVQMSVRPVELVGA